MSTLNPRLTVTLTPAVAAVLRELSSVSGNSQSAIVGDLLLHSLPVFERMVQVMQAVAAAQAKGVEVNEAALVDMREGLERAQGRIEQELGLFDELVQPVSSLLTDAERIKRRVGRVGRGAPATRQTRTARSASTPLSNRGVTPTQINNSTTQKRVKRGPL